MPGERYEVEIDGQKFEVEIEIIDGDGGAGQEAPAEEAIEKSSLLVPDLPGKYMTSALLGERTGTNEEYFGNTKRGGDYYGGIDWGRAKDSAITAAEILASVALPETAALRGPRAIRSILRMRNAPTFMSRLPGIAGESVLGTAGSAAVDQLAQETGLRRDAPVSEDLAKAAVQAGAGLAAPGLLEGAKGVVRQFTSYASKIRREVGEAVAETLGYFRNSVTPREQILGEMAAEAGGGATTRRFFSSGDTHYNPATDAIEPLPGAAPAPPSRYVGELVDRADAVRRDIGTQIETFVNDLQTARDALNAVPATRLEGAVIEVPQGALDDLNASWFTRGVGEEVERLSDDILRFSETFGAENVPVSFTRSLANLTQISSGQALSLAQVARHIKDLNAFERGAKMFDAAISSGQFAGDPSKLPAARVLADSMLSFTRQIRPVLNDALDRMVNETLANAHQVSSMIPPDAARRMAEYGPDTLRRLMDAYGDFKDLIPVLRRGSSTMAENVVPPSSKSLLSRVSGAAQTVKDLMPRYGGSEASDKSLVFNLQGIEDTFHSVRGQAPGAVERFAESGVVPGMAGASGVAVRERVMPTRPPAPTIVPMPAVAPTPTPAPDMTAAQAAVADAVIKAGKQAGPPPSSPSGMLPTPTGSPMDSLLAPTPTPDMPPPVLGGPEGSMGPLMPPLGPDLPMNGIGGAPAGTPPAQETKPMPRSVEGFFSLPTEAIAPEILQDEESQQLIIEAQNSAPAVKEKALGQIISKHKLLFESANPKFREYDIIVSDGTPKIVDDLKAAAYRKDVEEREASGKLQPKEATKWLNALNQSGAVLEFASEAKKSEQAAKQPAPQPETEPKPSQQKGKTESKVYPETPRTYPF